MKRCTCGGGAKNGNRRIRTVVGNVIERNKWRRSLMAPNTGPRETAKGGEEE